MFKRNFNLKKAILIASICMLVFMAGCGKTPEQPAQTPIESPAAPAPMPEAIPQPEKPALTAKEVVLERAKDFAAERASGANFMVAPADAWKNIQENDIFVVDVRAPEDFEKGHIPGSYNVNFVGGEIATLLDRIPMDKPVYVFCYSGQQANQVNGALNIAGFDAKAITGGANNWTKAELPLEGTGPNPLSEAPAVSKAETEEDQLAWESVEGYLGAIVSAETRNLIAAAKLHEELQANPDKYYVIDIRSPKADNYDQGHIEGSHFYSWDDIEKSMAEFPMDKKIVVGCWSGNNAGQAVALLKVNGYDAYSLLSGIDNGWLEKTKPEAERNPFPVVQ